MESCCTPIVDGLSAEEADRFASQLKVLADAARLRVVSLLATSGADGVCVCDLTGPLGLTQPTVSHHMKQLRDAGFVSAERRGKWVYYTLNSDRVDQVRSALNVRATV